jgi:hypothetical protein
MINIQTLGTLLRTLQTGDLTPRALAPLQPLAPTQNVKPVSSDTTQSGQTAGREAGGNPNRTPILPSGSPSPSHSAARVSDSAVSVLLSTLGGAGADAAAPRPHESTVARAPVAGGTAAAAASARPPEAPSTGRAAALQLSPTAFLLDELLRLPGGEPIRPARPLTSGPVEPAILAKALQQSIVRSGVFYESHLANWTTQSASLLRQEPQAFWAEATAVRAHGGVDAAVAAPAPAPGWGAALPDAAPAMVRQQIDVLETGQVLWRGEPWPGQPASIEIREDKAAREPGGPPAWRTRLVMDLPGLGSVEALLALAGNRIDLSLGTADAASTPVLREALPGLVKALTARALDVGTVAIRHEKPE